MPMETKLTTHEWWALVEELTYDPTLDPERPNLAVKIGGPEWMLGLARACLIVMGTCQGDARSILADVDRKVPPGSWSWILLLLSFQADALEAGPAKNAELSERVARMSEIIGQEDEATGARAYYLLARLQMADGLHDEAERTLIKALGSAGDSPLKSWILDDFGKILARRGAWSEARRTFKLVARLKQRSRDRAGVGATYGALAEMEMGIGSFGKARDALRNVIYQYGPSLPRLERFRLQTMFVSACVEDGAEEEALAESKSLENTYEKTEESGYLKGDACLAMARVAALMKDEARVMDWLSRSRRYFDLPAQHALVGFWEAALLSTPVDDYSWLEGMKELFEQVGGPSEAELRTYLLLSDLAYGSGDLESAAMYLDDALDMAAASGNAAWVERTDDVYSRRFPTSHARRTLERFAWGGSDEVGRELHLEASIARVEMAGFDMLSQDKDPAEVMEMARSFYQVALHYLGKWKVRPLTIDGAGLAAVSYGQDHYGRALSFALDITAALARVDLAREALGFETMARVRAGVSTGPLVMGGLGHHYKMEYAAIGKASAMAKALVGMAEPGRVAAMGPPPPDWGKRGKSETASIPGVAETIEVIKYAPDPIRD